MTVQKCSALIVARSPEFSEWLWLNCDLFTPSGGTEVITEDDYQNGHPDLEAASSGRLGVGRDKMVYMAVKHPPKEEEIDEDDSDDDDDDDIGVFRVKNIFCKRCNNPSSWIIISVVKQR